MDAAAQLTVRAGEALAASDWETAKRLFSEALSREEMPDALEGLARASFLLNDGIVAIEHRLVWYSTI